MREGGLSLGDVSATCAAQCSRGLGRVWSYSVPVSDSVTWMFRGLDPYYGYGHLYHVAGRERCQLEAMSLWSRGPGLMLARLHQQQGSPEVSSSSPAHSLGSTDIGEVDLEFWDLDINARGVGAVARSESSGGSVSGTADTPKALLYSTVSMPAKSSYILHSALP